MVLVHAMSSGKGHMLKRGDGEKQLGTIIQTTIFPLKVKLV